MKRKIMMIIFSFVMMIGVMQSANADLQLDSIYFDPAIIASGDEVDIVIQFHDENIPEVDDRIGSIEYTFDVRLEADDDLTEQYVTIQDASGDDVTGRIFAQGYYNKVFTVKVSQDAPAGNYEFKLTGQWYRNGEPTEYFRYVRFKMPVKREGIILDVATLNTVPSEVRPGDDYVEINTLVENVGQKDAKSVEVNLELPDGISSSYTNNNRLWIGRVNAGEAKEATFYVDVDDALEAEVYELEYSFEFSDVDDNVYYKSSKVPFLVKPRPYIEVVDVEGEGLAGQDSKLRVIVRNTGSESAEAVDVRILKQNSQPFTIDVRSDYIGELEPGEEGLAVFDIGVNREADIKAHDFKLLIRTKGDSDEGDDNIYTYNRRATFQVTGTAPNSLLYWGLGGAAVVVVLFLLNSIVRKKKGGRRR